MSWAGVAVGVAGTVIGGMNAANAADSAAEAQIGSVREGNALQRQMFEESRSDQAPWLQRGNAAGNLLQYYLGIDPNGAPSTFTGQGAMGNLGPMPTIEQFTTHPTGGGVSPWYTPNTDTGRGSTLPAEALARTQMVPGSPVIDKEGFHAALLDWNTKKQAQEAAARGDPRFGSLLKQFTGDQLASDPGYQFGVNQGEEAITNNRAALGSLLSGETLKSLTMFGNDYGGTKFNEAAARDQADKQLKYNMLSGVSGTGNATANSIAGNSATAGNAMSQNIIGAGNARASGYIGSANAINSAIGGSINQYNSANLLKSLNSGYDHGMGDAGTMIVRNGGSDPYEVPT